MAFIPPAKQMTSTCTKCGKAIRYVNVSRTMSVWVHVDSGQGISMENGRHDASTYADRKNMVAA